MQLIYFDVKITYIFFNDLSKFFGSLEPPVQSALSTVSGVYETTGASIDPLIGGMPSSLPLEKYASPMISFGSVLLLSLVMLIYSIRRFETKDIM